MLPHENMSSSADTLLGQSESFVEYVGPDAGRMQGVPEVDDEKYYGVRGGGVSVFEQDLFAEETQPSMDDSTRSLRAMSRKGMSNDVKFGLWIFGGLALIGLTVFLVLYFRQPKSTGDSQACCGGDPSKPCMANSQCSGLSKCNLGTCSKQMTAWADPKGKLTAAKYTGDGKTLKELDISIDSKTSEPKLTATGQCEGSGNGCKWGDADYVALNDSSIFAVWDSANTALTFQRGDNDATLTVNGDKLTRQKKK